MLSFLGLIFSLIFERPPRAADDSQSKDDSGPWRKPEDVLDPEGFDDYGTSGW